MQSTARKPKPRPALSTVNQALREWTRGTSFTLAMGRTQVATLVALHASQNRAHLVGRDHRLLRLFVQAARALGERGLVRHHPWQDQQEFQRRVLVGRFRLFFEVTRAGELVVQLLREAGIYQELLAEFEGRAE